MDRVPEAATAARDWPLTEPLGHLASLQSREQLAALAVGQARVLEMVARGAPLGETLTMLVRVLEQQADGMICTVLLLSDDGRRVSNGAAPSLPAAFAEFIEGKEIGPRAGSCGTAAYLRRQVVVTDIATDPLWEPYRAPALAVGLRACWSTPILSRRDEVLGTFAIYYHEPAAPKSLHAQLIALATHLAGVAIEQARIEQDRARLLGELSEQRRALETAGRQKDQFLGMLAHELRNPLAAISNAAALARMRSSRGLDLDAPLAVLERQVRNSSRLLDDLLDIARFTRGVVQLQRTSLRLEEVVAGAVEGQRALLERRGHRLSVSMPDDPVVLEGDPTRLEQVVANLLNNAVKYSPDGSHLQIVVERQPGAAILRVRDDGLGIAPDLLPRVFDPFVQADRTLARTQGGLGLGLAISQNIVALHGGTIHAHSAGVGRGSEFVVTLPLGSGAAVQAPRAGATGIVAADRRAPGRILVVEDNLDAATTLEEALRALGHDVDVVDDGAKGLEAARRGVYRVVLLDIGLPVIDGYEVARRIHAEMGERAPVLIALTGYGQEEDRNLARRAGIDHHLTKPFGLADLERLLAQHLEEPLAAEQRPV